MFAQITFLVIGIYLLNFDISYINILLVVCTNLITQLVFCKFFKVNFVAKNPVITALSISLVLRSNSYILFILAGVMAIASKFIIRVNNRHIFNPAIFGVSTVLLFSESAWISPGQWGNSTWTLALLIIIGMFVAEKSNRIDVALAFILTYILLIILRGIWLGEPVNLVFYQFENGAAFLFTFFTISDPRTTPETPIKRIAFGAFTGVCAIVMRYYFYNSYYIVYSLAITSTLVLLLKVFKSLISNLKFLVKYNNKTEKEYESNYL